MPLIRKPVNTSTSRSAVPSDVLKRLLDGDQEQRWSAARAAADVPGAADALAEALQAESDPRVREAMLTSLMRIGSPASIASIVRFLRSDDASLRTGAMDALRTRHDVVRAHLPSLMNDADSDVRVLSCEVVRGLPSDEATQMLCALLSRESEPNVCAAAIDVLAEVGDARALPVLAECEKRFRNTPFLVFATKIATARILEQSTERHD
jgi:HEAT repeat protein